MWAEIMTEYKKGEAKFILSKEAEAELETKRELFIGEDTDKGMIASYLETTGKTEVCILELYQEAFGNMGKPDRRESNEIADILRNSLGFEDSAGKTKRFGKYGIQKYFRKRNKEIEKFQLVPKQMEIPFDT